MRGTDYKDKLEQVKENYNEVRDLLWPGSAEG